MRLWLLRVDLQGSPQRLLRLRKHPLAQIGITQIGEKCVIGRRSRNRLPKHLRGARVLSFAHQRGSQLLDGGTKPRLPAQRLLVPADRLIALPGPCISISQFKVEVRCRG